MKDKARAMSFRSRTPRTMNPTPQTVPQDRDDLLRAVLSAAVEGILVFDTEGFILAYSAACEVLFGYNAAEVVGKNITLLIPLPNQDEAFGTMLVCEGADEKWITGSSREVVGVHEDKSTFPMCLSLGRGHLDGREILVGIVHGLTNRKLNEALIQREASLRSVLDTVPDAIITIDEAGLITSFNQTASNFFGYRASEVIGKNVNMLMPSPYRNQSDESVTGLFGDGRQPDASDGHIVVGKRRDGSTFPMEISLGQATKRQKRFFVCFVRDLTRRQGVVQRLEQLQAELLHVSRLNSMGQMAAAIAHELNQPLTAISNYVSAARRTLDSSQIAPAIATKARDILDKAANQTLRAGKILKNLKEYVEKREIERRPEHLERIITEALALAFVGAADTNIKVVLQLDPRLTSIMVDRIQIEQVLMNLIRNSMEAMSLSATRELSLSSCAGAPGFADITVRDTGPGLPEGIARRLFQPFTTTKSAGMGVGLAICRSIVEQNGGRIWLLQNSASGAAFRFSLPVADQMAVAARARNGPRSWQAAPDRRPAPAGSASDRRTCLRG
jgi:two-component system sensor kinase FixL